MGRETTAKQNVVLIKNSFGGSTTYTTTLATPIVVVMDPGIENNDKLDLTDANNVKLWVVNRVPIYFLPKIKKNKNSVLKWKSAFGDYQGCLTERTLSKYRSKGRLLPYRKFLTPLQKIDIHIATIAPADPRNLSDRQSLIIKDVEIRAAEFDVKRPYPEDATWTEFNTKGSFKNGVRLIRLPAEKIYKN